MKKYLLVLIAICAIGTSSLSQSEIEPNDDFATANFINDGAAAFGSLYQSTPTDNFDFFTFTLLENGSVDIAFEVTNLSGIPLGADFILFYANTSQASGFNSVSVPVLQTVGDVFHYDCLAAGSYYMRVEASGMMNYSLEYTGIFPIPVNETEPNGSFNEATFLPEAEIATGELGYYNVAGDYFDYYMITLSEYSSITVDLTVTVNSAGTGSSEFILWNSIQGQLSNWNSVSASNYQTESGSFTFHCLAPGNYYMSLQPSNSCTTYEISYSSESVLVPTETEPNDDFADADFMEEGIPQSAFLSFANGASDGYDFYKFTLDNYGTVNITVNSTSTSNVDAFSNFVGFYGNFSQFSGFNGFNTPAGGTATTEFTFQCFAPGDYYLRFTSNSCVAYEVSYDFTAQFNATETEPNDSFVDADVLVENESQLAYIGFANGTTDGYDYFTFNLPQPGTVLITVNGYSTSSIDAVSNFIGFFGNEQQFSGFSGFTTPVGESSSTEFLFSCFAAGQYYLRFTSNTCVAYDVSFDFITPFAPIETEPNDTQPTASLIELDETVTGFTAVQNNPYYDYDDYFKVAVPDSSRIVLVGNFYEMAPASNIGGNLYAYNSLGQQIGYKNMYFNEADSFTDSLVVDCFNNDTIWFRINATGCRAYDFQVHTASRLPVADFEIDRLGNDIGFIPSLENNTGFLWNFDDGQTSTAGYPLHHYAFGNWSPQLIAYNNICNYTDTASIYFEIAGVEYYAPTSAGRGGETAMEIFGGSLSEETIVKLIKDSNEILPIELYPTMASNVLRAIFDLHLAEVGMYDVEITIPGLDPILYADGFEVEEFVYPYAWSQVVGPALWRINRDVPFNLVVGNTGNVTASGVMVGLIYPEGITVELLHDIIIPPDTGLMEVTVEDTLYSLDRSEYHFIYDSLATFYPIDSLWGEPYNGYFAHFKIPYIPAGHTYELPFIARGTSGMPVEFITFAHKPNVFGSPSTPNWYDTVENLGVETIDLVDMAADEVHNVPLQVLTKTLKVGQKHLAADARIAGANFWAWWDGYDVPAETYSQYWRDIDAANTFALKTSAEVLRDQALSVGNNFLNGKSQERIAGMNEMLAKNGHILTDEGFEKVLANIASEAGTNNRLNVLFKTLKDAGTLADKIASIEELVNQCPELQDMLDDLLKNANDNLNPNNIRRTPTNLITAQDPNAIYGPMGIGSEQFINDLDKQFFGISFENVDTATADAQVVIVLDTLDLDVFDASSFEFGDIFIAGQGIRVPRGRQEFALDFFPESNPSYKVRLNANFDQQTGVIRWQLTTLDTLTESLPMLEGFLAPNITSPEGEGYLYYSVNPYNDLPNGSQLASKAEIIFDSNEPVETNTWSNVVDILAPESSLGAFVANDTIIHIQLSGTDAGCGLSQYKVYVSHNDGPFLALFTTFEDEVEMIGEIGSTYGIYCTAIDSLGNTEEKDAIAEVEVVTSIRNYGELLTLFSVYPNPGSGLFNIAPSSPLHKAKLLVYNSAGELVYSQRVSASQGEIIPLDLRNFSAGQYLVRMETAKGSFAAQQVVRVE